MARKNRHKRLICYARPEKHASRNLFEICILAIRHALHQGAFSGRWTFHGIGSLGGEYDVDLGGGHHMKIEPRIPQQDYERIIRSFDVGLSLMWAPHPSVLPYELARGGVVTVTNEYGTRTQSQLAKFGHNIVAAIPTIEGVAAALRVAAGRSDDVQARLKGALFDWPTNWDKVFDDRFFRALASQFQIPAGCKR
jgi:hypothetical protein